MGKVLHFADWITCANASAEWNNNKNKKINNWSTCFLAKHARNRELKYRVRYRWTKRKKERNEARVRRYSRHRLSITDAKICIPSDWYLLVANWRHSTRWREISLRENATPISEKPYQIDFDSLLVCFRIGRVRPVRTMRQSKWINLSFFSIVIVLENARRALCFLFYIQSHSLEWNFA